MYTLLLMGWWFVCGSAFFSHQPRRADSRVQKTLLHFEPQQGHPLSFGQCRGIQIRRAMSGLCYLCTGKKNNSDIPRIFECGALLTQRGGPVMKMFSWRSYTCSTFAKSISSSQSYVQFSIYGNYFLTLTLYCHLLSCKGLLSCNVVTSNKALDTCMCTVSVPQLYSLSHCYQKQHAHTNSLFSPDSHLALGGSTSLAQSVFPQHCTWHNVQMRVSLGWHTALPRQSDTTLASVPLVNSQANCIQTEQTIFFFFSYGWMMYVPWEWTHLLTWCCLGGLLYMFPSKGAMMQLLHRIRTALSVL